VEELDYICPKCKKGDLVLSVVSAKSDYFELATMEHNYVSTTRAVLFFCPICKFELNAFRLFEDDSDIKLPKEQVARLRNIIEKVLGFFYNLFLVGADVKRIVDELEEFRQKYEYYNRE
jgi:ssDNA-binding Zn-finger/Zn-ribbon topoisomerase 1